MGSIKDRNGRDLTEAEDIKKRWQAYTEELYKKGLNDPNNHDGTVTHLEPDILEWVVISFSRVSSPTQQFGKLSSGHRTGKGQFSFQSQRKAISKNVQTTAQLQSSHTLAK